MFVSYNCITFLIIAIQRQEAINRSLYLHSFLESTLSLASKSRRLISFAAGPLGSRGPRREGNEAFVFGGYPFPSSFIFKTAFFPRKESRSVDESDPKAHANGRNKSQHCCALLGIFSQQCCVRLHGPKSLTCFKLYARNANECQYYSGSMHMDTTCWAQQCCVSLANNVASVCIGL